MSIYQEMFDDSHKRAINEIGALRVSLKHKISHFDESKISVNDIVSDELKKQKIIHIRKRSQKFGELKMPNIKVVNPTVRCNSELHKDTMAMPLKLRVVNY